ncbi:hypothetical protein [Pseudomonas sp. EMN2]|uniref:hypothetical protein n=1 Tax=Pseudomonas sp. EMN2 TaxID=2615212 RepID=UPI00129A4B3A|nr:hypothetical protein [Pseudomonas sp. EMN2]
MSIELRLHIAALAAAEALSLMAKKAGVQPKDILDVVLADPEGNTARYFGDLVKVAIREVPALLTA